jgi:hypothetical protein
MIAAVPIIRTRTKGHFHCTRCRVDNRAFSFKTHQVWFAIFFLPIFPLGFKREFVECDWCLATFGVEAMDAEPPTRSQYFLADCSEGLAHGWALETVESDLIRAGYERSDARRMIEEVAGGQIWACPRCDLHYGNAAVYCLNCGAKRVDETGVR